MEIEITKMRLDHAVEVQKLTEQLGYPLTLSEIQNNLTQVTTSPDHTAFVALHNDKIVGWIHAFKCLFIESNPFIEIGGLVVDGKHRSKGIGKELVNKIKEWSYEKEISELRVRSNVLRSEAHQFYVNNGFIEIKQQKVFLIKL